MKLVIRLGFWTKIAVFILLAGCSSQGGSSSDGSSIFSSRGASLTNDMKYGLGEFYSGASYAVLYVEHPESDVYCVRTQSLTNGFILSQIIFEDDEKLTIGRAAEQDYLDNNCTTWTFYGSADSVADYADIIPAREELRDPKKEIVPFESRY